MFGPDGLYMFKLVWTIDTCIMKKEMNRYYFYLRPPFKKFENVKENIKSKNMKL